MTRDELAKLVLLEVALQCGEAKQAPRPPAWQTLAVWEHEDAIEYGPRYTPTWFGDMADTDARRVRILRTIYRLAGAGLLAVVKGEGGRLQRVRLTEAGDAAVEAMLQADAAAPA